MTIQLNDDQQNVTAYILNFVTKKERDSMCLWGSAGTGKTTTLQYLFGHLPKGTEVCFTATTNKAVKVLRTMATKKNLNIECLTIHSLLGLSMQFKDGKESLKKGGKSQFNRFNLVVIDESSMINTELLGYIHRAINKSDGGTQVLFVGDANQLPPVGEKMSPVFMMNNKVTLTKVMRQREENPILGLCNDIRAEIDNGTFNVPQIIPATNKEGNIGVHVMSGEMFKTWMPSAFSHENFNDNYDKFRVIAWRNHSVNHYNEVIQRLRYPDLTLPFAIGEPVVFSKPLHFFSTKSDYSAEQQVSAGWNDILCSTESEAIVENIVEVAPFVFKPSEEQEKAGFTFRPFTIPRYMVTVKMIDDDAIRTCAIAGDKRELNDLKKFVSNHAKNNSAHGLSWFVFYAIDKYFAELRPGYALTAHKSQGSTYNNVFVDMNDITSNPDREEALRCLYVAVSRASENVVIKL